MAVLMMDVARRAGVSVTTVSHVMNETREIAPDTRERVLTAIEDLKYYKNNSARLLVRGHSDTFGLIISDIENPILPELVKSFVRSATSAGFEVLLGMTNYEQHKAEAAVRRMIESRVRGVAIMTSQLDRRLVQRLRQAELPVVMLDVAKKGRLQSTLCVDYSAGLWAAVDHLSHLGHTKVGMIHGPLDVVSAAKYLALVREAVWEYGLELLGVVEGDGRPEGGSHGVMTLLRMKRAPTAILCGNDLMAIGALGMALRMGRSVPHDLSIIGCDDIAIASYSQPSLSTVRIPRDDMGHSAFRQLQKMVTSNSRRGREVVVTTSFIARASTGEAPTRSTMSFSRTRDGRGKGKVRKKNAEGRGRTRK